MHPSELLSYSRALGEILESAPAFVVSSIDSQLAARGCPLGARAFVEGLSDHLSHVDGNASIFPRSEADNSQGNG